MNAPQAPRRLIVNADDLGASSGVNAGIVEAHTRGIVTSASLMVTMPATREAVAAARTLGSLSVGLHVNLTGEGAAPAPVATLDDLVACGREIARQIELFHRLVGRPPTHLDAHHNIHREPQLTGLFLAAADALRVPLREHSAVRYLPDFYGQWDGQTHPEQISVERLLRMIDEDVGPGVTELGCHPGHVDPAFSSPYHRERELELATLCDPTVRDHLVQRGVELVGFADLGPTGTEGRP